MRFRFPLLAAFALALSACEPPSISMLSPEEGMQRIRNSHSEENWDFVVSEVNEYRSRYPYSQYAAEAELLQADAYFQSMRLPEAIAAYEEFLKRNPNHAQAPLAAFRIARCYDKQSPEEVDREQVFALRALERYSSFLERYPTAADAAQAKERIQTLRRRLADHTAFVARFYWKRGQYQGALTRYLEVLEDFPFYEDLRKEAGERAAESYRELAKALERDPKSDATLFYSRFTPGDLRKKADEVAKLAAAAPVAAPGDAKAPAATGTSTN